MEFSRRHLLGALGVAGAALGLPRGIAPDRAIAQTIDLTATDYGRDRFHSVLLPRVRAALDRHAALITDRATVGLVDFSAPSRAPRFYLLDMTDGQVISTHLVAHGRGSDPDNSGWVQSLSNRPGSFASCDGAFLTGPAYVGEHGRSRRLIGLEPQNDMAEARAIVIHAASYVDPGMASGLGRIGRSQGCFAVTPREIDDVLELLPQGSMLLAVR